MRIMDASNARTVHNYLFFDKRERYAIVTADGMAYQKQSLKGFVKKTETASLV